MTKYKCRRCRVIAEVSDDYYSPRGWMTDFSIDSQTTWANVCRKCVAEFRLWLRNKK
jgi:hypothetical protein